MLDFAELNAPPMINYGVVYPQAILIFTITLLYSIIQPLILIFGAVYFGVAYVVYKYKLLFGAHSLKFYFLTTLITEDVSVLQTIRVSRSSMAHHLYTSHLGRCHLHHVHDRNLHPSFILYPFFPSHTLALWDCSVVILHV